MDKTRITAPEGTPYIDMERDFDAPAELVHRAYVDPDLVEQWLGPRKYEMVIDRWDARAGGAYRYVHRDGENEHGFRGRVPLDGRGQHDPDLRVRGRSGPRLARHPGHRGSSRAVGVASGAIRCSSQWPTATRRSRRAWAPASTRATTGSTAAREAEGPGRRADRPTHACSAPRPIRRAGRIRSGACARCDDPRVVEYGGGITNGPAVGGEGRRLARSSPSRTSSPPLATRSTTRRTRSSRCRRRCWRRPSSSSSSS